MRYYILKRSDSFSILKRRKGKYTSDEMLKELKTLNLDNKIIYKSSMNFREVSYEDFLELKYSEYLFVDKKEKNNMERWIEFIKKNKVNLRYLDKPLPKFYEFNIIEFEELKKKINNDKKYM